MGWNNECELAKGYLSEYDRGYQNGSKETVEKILKIIKSTNFTKEYLCELIIQIFGVEIKE